MRGLRADPAAVHHPLRPGGEGGHRPDHSGRSHRAGPQYRGRGGTQAWGARPGEPRPQPRGSPLDAGEPDRGGPPATPRRRARRGRGAGGAARPPGQGGAGNALPAATDRGRREQSPAPGPRAPGGL